MRHAYNHEGKVGSAQRLVGAGMPFDNMALCGDGHHIGVSNEGMMCLRPLPHHRQLP